MDLSVRTSAKETLGDVQTSTVDPDDDNNNDVDTWPQTILPPPDEATVELSPQRIVTSPITPPPEVDIPEETSTSSTSCRRVVLVSEVDREEAAQTDDAAIQSNEAVAVEVEPEVENISTLTWTVVDPTPVPESTSSTNNEQKHIEHSDVIAALRSVIAASRGRLLMAAQQSSTGRLSRMMSDPADDVEETVLPPAVGTTRKRRFDAHRRPLTVEDADDEEPEVQIRRTVDNGIPNTQQLEPAVVTDAGSVGRRSGKSATNGNRLSVRGARLGRRPSYGNHGNGRVRGVAPLSLRQFFENGGRDYDEYLSKIGREAAIADQQHEQQQQQQQQQQHATVSTTTNISPRTPREDGRQRFEIPPTVRTVSAFPNFAATPPQLPVILSHFDKPLPPYNAVSSASRSNVASPQISPSHVSHQPAGSSALRFLLEPTTPGPLAHQNSAPRPPPSSVGGTTPPMYGTMGRTSPIVTPIESAPVASESVFVLDLSRKSPPISPEGTNVCGRRRNMGVPNCNVGGAEYMPTGRTKTPATVRQPAQAPPSMTLRPGPQQSGQSFCTDVRSWTVDEVVRFVLLVPGCSEYAETFRREKIDGVGFAHLSDDHLLHVLKMRLGPALRLRIAIDAVRGGGTNASGAVALAAASANRG